MYCSLELCSCPLSEPLAQFPSLLPVPRRSSFGGSLSHLSIAVKRAEFHQPLTGAGPFYYQPPERSCRSRVSFNTSNLQLLYASAAAGWCGVSCAGARHLQKALGASWARSGESLGGSPCPLYAGGVRCLIRLAFPSRGRGEVSSLSKEHLSEARVPRGLLSFGGAAGTAGSGLLGLNPSLS